MSQTNLESTGFAPSAGLEECLRVARLVNTAHGAMGPVTWQAGFRVVQHNWQPWLRDCFEPWLLPVLLRSVELGAGGFGRELIAVDRLPRLAALSHGASTRAGHLLLRQGVPAGAKALQKLAEAVQKQEAAGHLATVFGARCGIFSIQPRLAVLGYLFTELRLGAPDWHDQQIAERLDEARPLIQGWLQVDGQADFNGKTRSHG